MSSSGGAPKSSKRVRRAARPYGEAFERFSASVAASDARGMQKNPTRYIPDGFEGLSKAEIKADSKLVVKNSEYCMMLDSEEEKDMNFFESNIKVSMKPPCIPTSSILKKKRRLVNWITHPSVTESEIDFWDRCAAQAHQDFKNYLQDKELWYNSIDIMRRKLHKMLENYTAINRKLTLEGAELEELCEKEVMKASAYSTRKRKGSSITSISEILEKTQNTILKNITEYEKLFAECSEKKKLDQAYCSHIEVDELLYPEDEHLWIQGKRKRIRYTTDTDTVLIGAKKYVRDPIDDAINMINMSYFPPSSLDSPQTSSSKRSAATTDPTSSETDSKSTSVADEDQGSTQIISNLTKSAEKEATEGSLKQKFDTDINLYPHLRTMKDKVISVMQEAEEAVKQNEMCKTGLELLFLEREEQDGALISSIVKVNDKNTSTITEIDQFIMKLRDKYRLYCEPGEIYHSQLIDVISNDKNGISHARNQKEGQKQENTMELVPFNQDESQLSNRVLPYLSLVKEEDWGEFATEVLDIFNKRQNAAKSRKRKSPKIHDPIALSTYARSRVERGIPVLFSPLSQYEDRYMGTINADTLYSPVQNSNDNSLEKAYKIHSINKPHSLVIEEENFFERCRLQSLAAIVELKLRQTKKINNELNSLIKESCNAYKKYNLSYERALVDSMKEKEKIVKELEYYGISNENGKGNGLQDANIKACS